MSRARRALAGCGALRAAIRASGPAGRARLVLAALLGPGALSIFVASSGCERGPGGRSGESAGGQASGGLESAGEGDGGAAPAPVLSWTDVTAAAGIAFRHESGARGEMLNPETFGPGAGWLDADGDGRADLLCINGTVLRGAPDSVPDLAAVSRLYRNAGGGRFEDITDRSGLGVPLYGMGFASADADGDGDEDVLIYGLRRSVLFINRGGARFEEAAASSGLDALRGWVGAAAFFDFDRDGALDLFAGNYVDWSPEREEGADCTLGGAAKAYCPVALFPPSAPQLLRGRGDGTFEDVTARAGLAGLEGKALGLAIEDFDRDGWPDVFVANDSVPGFLLRNRGDGTFEDRGIASGFATDAGGAALAGMGIDAAWAPDGGPLALAIGNFSGEPTTLHVQEDTAYFVERSFEAGVGRPTLDRVTFGVLLEDFDLDGRIDLAIANGHVFDAEPITRIPYRQRCQLFLGRSELAGGPTWRWRFEEALPSSPALFLSRPILGRALASADYDGDGDLDLVLTENQGGVLLLRNDVAPGGRSARIDLEGAGKARSAVGAEAEVRIEGPRGPRTLRRTRKAASSYLAQSDRGWIVALGPGERAASIAVRWPSGRREAFGGLEAGGRALLVEGAGARLEAEVGLPGEEAGPRGAEAALAPAAPPRGASSVAHRRRGIEALEAGRIGEAIAELDDAIRKDPFDAAAHRARLRALRRASASAGASAGASAALGARVEEIAASFPDAGMLLGFALLLREEREPGLAGRLLERAARLDPSRPDVWIALGNLAFDRGAHDEALARYARALELYPQSVEALVNTGKVHVIRKDFRTGATFLEKALAIRPGYAAALSPLGGALIELGDLERAEAALERALRSAPSRETLITVHGNLGILHLRRRDRARAIEAFERVLALEPGDAKARDALERLRRPPGSGAAR